MHPMEPTQRAPIGSSPLSVILFAHALSTETSDALAAWRQYLETLRRPYEILLVQETRPEVPATEPPPGTRVFTYERAVGFRAAVNEATQSAQHPLVAFCQCDKQYAPADLERMLQTVDQVDLVVGYRTGGQAPLWRVVLDLVETVFCRILLGISLGPRVCWLGGDGWSRRWVARWIFGVRVLDPECPFRLARRSIFAHLPMQSSGSFLPVEMLAKANHLTCLLAEEPVTWTPPTNPPVDAIPFGQDAWLIFHHPDFVPLQPPCPAPVANPPADPSPT